jgi:hypothetical protein
MTRRRKMDETDVPTFLCKGEKIVEVMYSRWGEISTGEWRLLESTPNVVLGEAIDRVVFELPTGCFDLAAYGVAGSNIGFRNTTYGEEGSHPGRCERPHGYEEAMRESSRESSAVVNDAERR